MTLTVDKPRDYELGDHNDLPVIAGGKIYEGAAVGFNNSGYARPLEGGDVFGGFALRICDNTGGTAGAKRIRTLVRGAVVLPVTGLTIDDIGKPVYASDDDTFTLTAGGNTQVGAVKRYIADGLGTVEFWVPRAPGTVTESDIANGAVSLNKLADAIKPSHIVVAAGDAEWSGDGATLVAEINGILETDIVLATIKEAPTQAAFLASAEITDADEVTFTLSAANSSNDAVIAYTVLRAAV